MFLNYFFDCDGVVLNSNIIKSNGFYFACREFGDVYANKLLDFHRLNGGISRYKKFEFFIKEILNVPFSTVLYENLLEKYASYVSNELLNCEVAYNLERIRLNIPKSSKWYIVSGGDQKELRTLFKSRNLDHLFDGGIYGSPMNKFDIMKFVLPENANECNSILLGDSLYDYKVASSYGIAFTYISKWSEFDNIFSHAEINQVPIHPDIQSFFSDFHGALPDSQSS